MSCTFGNSCDWCGHFGIVENVIGFGIVANEVGFGIVENVLYVWE
jgi:hypothetical protein